MEANATKDDPSKVINIASIDGVGIADYDFIPTQLQSWINSFDKKFG